MFISALDLFKIGIGPSSSHTMGPMLAARKFIALISERQSQLALQDALHVRCILKGSLAFTGHGHGTDRAVALGLHGYTAESLADADVDAMVRHIHATDHISMNGLPALSFSAERDILFDHTETLPQHPNGMIFELMGSQGQVVLSETYFSVGGGFIERLADIGQLVAPLKMVAASDCPYPFDSARTMLAMAEQHTLTIATMKRRNEQHCRSDAQLDQGLDDIWQGMRTCVERGLANDGILPGGLELQRRAAPLHRQLQADPDKASVIDWLCAYAMAVNEENAAGHMVVTAPTNGAAGVIPSVLYYLVEHLRGTQAQVRDFLVVASAIGGIIKHRSSISGAEVGCQGEVGSAASMAAAGLCAVQGGSSAQIENAAEIALEHHLGMTCDPVNGLVQVPCIERNGFGAVKAYTAASLALHGSGQHFMPLDNCIAAMKQTGLEMSMKFKETSLGGLAVSLTEC